jgi:hypothetical protein
MIHAKELRNGDENLCLKGNRVSETRVIFEEDGDILTLVKCREGVTSSAILY